jgi:alpha-L-rhamnosidase
MSSPRVTAVTVERRRDGAFAETPTPRLSWVVESDAPGWRQRAAEIRLDGARVARLDGDASVLVDWPFAPLLPHARHVVEVRVTGADGEASAWSEPVALRSVFLADGEWRAPFVELAEPGGEASPGLVRTEFEVDRPVASATLYAAGQGVYQAALNGRDVDDALLKPGWTSYQYRIEHEATDVTDLVAVGRNALGIRFAGGWFTERFGFHGHARRVYGHDQPAVAAQLHLTYADGTSDVVTTGPHWRGAAAGPVVSSGIYAGERIETGKKSVAFAVRFGADRTLTDDRLTQSVFEHLRPISPTSPRARTSRASPPRTLGILRLTRPISSRSPPTTSRFLTRPRRCWSWSPGC